MNRRFEAFMSYAHHDDRNGRLTKLRDGLSDEVRAHTGEPFEIFLDYEDIGLGEDWRQRLESGLAEATFLVAILTPSFLKSEYCRSELAMFIEHESDLGRDDLILPIRYIDYDWLVRSDDENVRRAISMVEARQNVDWRDLEPRRPSDPKVKRALRDLALRVREAIARVQEQGVLTVEPAKPVVGEVDPEFLALSSRFYGATLGEREKTAAEMRRVAPRLPLEELLQLAASRSPGERVGAAICLGVHLEHLDRPGENARLISTLRALLDDSRERVRYRAAEAVASRPDLVPEFEKLLLRLAETDANQYVQKMARRALGRSTG